MKDNFHLDIQLSLFANCRIFNIFQNLSSFINFLQIIFSCSTTDDLHEREGSYHKKVIR